MASEHFAQWLARELSARTWSQGELARRSGLSQSMVSLLILGKNAPGPDTLVCLARAFNMRREDVFRVAGYLDPLPDPDDPALPELQYLVKRLPRAARERVLDYARFVDQRHPIVRDGPGEYANEIEPLFHALPQDKRELVVALLRAMVE